MFDFENIFGVVILIVLASFENLNFVKESLGITSNEEEEEDINTVLGEIFYLYNHASEREWLKWINKQAHETRVKAAMMICNHLEDHPKHWGYITLEAIECLKGFKDLLIDHKIAAFIHKTSKIWQEYKSIPSYYEKAAGVLAKINPDSAVEHFREELEKHSGSQASIEKKRILINTLPGMREKAKDLMIDILSNSHEHFGIKSHALRLSLKFPMKTSQEILLETLRRIIKKHKSSSRGLKTEELHFAQDLVEDSIHYISRKDFYEVFNEGCYIYQLQKIIINSLIRYLENTKSEPTSLTYYAASMLQDNKNDDLKRTLARKQNLTEAELNSLVLQPTMKDISEATLTTIPIEDAEIPVPEILREEYENFKNLFFKNIDKYEVVTSEKIFGGVLVTGTENIEKMFLTKALAKEKNWNFGFIDISKIQSRDSYQKSLEIFSKLRKPYVIYIKNPQLFFMKSDPNVDSFREKFAQTLGIQSLDSKSYLVGDINVKIEDTEHTNLGEAIRNLKYKYFPQSYEINKRPDTDKYRIVEQFLKYVSPIKFENQSELCEELSNYGKNFNSIEFMFFVIRTLSLMLLVFGKGVSYKEVLNLEDSFKKQNLEIENTGAHDILIEEDGLETTINATQVGQSLELQAPTDSSHES